MTTLSQEQIDWMDKHTDYLEHGGDDPTGFWPHKCEECVYFEGDGECALMCIQYRDLSLAAYVALRLEERKVQVPSV